MKPPEWLARRIPKRVDGSRAWIETVMVGIVAVAGVLALANVVGILRLHPEVASNMLIATFLAVLIMKVWRLEDRVTRLDVRTRRQQLYQDLFNDITTAARVAGTTDPEAVNAIARDVLVSMARRNGDVI